MNSEILKARTKAYSIAIVNLLTVLPYNVLNKNYSNQLVRCSSSVGANYRAACRAKSTGDFLNKLKIVEEELDESMVFKSCWENLMLISNLKFKKIGKKEMNYYQLSFLPLSQLEKTNKIENHLLKF